MRLLRTATVLAVTLLGSGAMRAALSQDAADKPLTGRAIPCKDGRIENFSCSNVELLSYLPASDLNGAIGFDIWGWTDSTTGREFIITGSKTGTVFTEVTDPLHPTNLGLLPPHGGAEVGNAQSVKVYKNYAFIGFEGGQNGIQVFDLTQLRNVAKPPATFQETVHYDKFASTHTIILNPASGFLYAAGVSAGGETCGSGLHMVNVQTPTTPTFAGCYTEKKSYGLSGPAYVHDAQCVNYRGPDKKFQGREICINSMGGVVAIADMTDKQHPQTLNIFSYPNIGYAHQGWFTEDQRYFFLDDEMDENPGAVASLAQMTGQTQQPLPTDAGPQHTRTLVFDLSDLSDPTVLTQYYASTYSVDHNLYIRGRYMYQGNYGAGLRIVDVGDPKNPKEVGFLTEIGDAWGTYPFLKNDVVAVSTDRGLFLARLAAR